MQEDSDELNRLAHVDLTNRAKGGIVIYFLAWLIITLPFEYPDLHPEFFYLNTAIFSVIFAIRLSHIRFLRRYPDAPIILLNRWLVGGILIAGLHWGMITGWSVLNQTYEDIRFFLIISVATLAIAGTTTLSISSTIRVYYPLLVFCPFVLALTYVGGVHNMVLAAMAILAFIYVVFTSKISHFDYWSAIRNRVLAEQHAGEMKLLSITDQLTQLKNRSFFDQRFEEEWKRCNRQKISISILMLDLDHFKTLNDSHGHAFGDHCLQRVGEVLRKQTLRETDIVARYGGEEFVVLLPGADATIAARIGEVLRRAIEAIELDYDGIQASVTCSIGGASALSKCSRSKEDLLKQADQSLYTAKHNGRNCYHAA